MFTPDDIIWVKNVNRPDGTIAYTEKEDIDKDTFILHFPDTSGKNVLTPGQGEIILLCQKAKFSHLVVPVDGKEIEDKKGREGFRRGRKVKVIARISPEKEFIPIWPEVGIVTQGGKVSRISNIKKLSGREPLLRAEIWEQFLPFFSDFGLLNSDFEFSEGINSTDQGAAEGRRLLVSHCAQERNGEIVKKKKQEALRKGELKCCVCGFSFVDNFGVEFIECHHIIPMSKSGETVTTLDDLALVCSNCHSMLHHRKSNGEYPSIEELTQKRRP